MPWYSSQYFPDPSALTLSPSLPLGLRFKTLKVPFISATRELHSSSLHNRSVDGLPWGWR